MDRGGKGIVWKGHDFQRWVKLGFASLFFLCIFLFFTFLYNHHLHFEEQMQLFLWSGDYLMSSIKMPGGFAVYAGEFLVQFYYLPFVGALIITALLFAVQRLVKGIVYSVKPDTFFEPLTYLPSLIYWIMLCDEFYFLSGLLGFTGVLLMARLYVSIADDVRRLLAGWLMVIVAYFLFGGAYIALAAIVSAFELLRRAAPSERAGEEASKPDSLSPRRGLFILSSLLLILFTILIPIIVKYLFVLENTIMAFITPAYYNIYSPSLVLFIPPALILLFSSVPLLMVFFRRTGEKKNPAWFMHLLPALVVALVAFAGLKKNMNPLSEEVMLYDHLARNGKWQRIIAYAEHHPPRNNNLCLSMLNLALAKTGQLPEKMFNFVQHDSYGLFVPYAADYALPIFTSEVFYHMGLVNASQQYAFESLSSTPGNKQNVRAIRRLAETNLINGQYRVAEKYINLLEKTLFYRKWAREARKLLYHDDLVDNDPEYGSKRNLQFTEDFFFTVGDMDVILKKMLEADPENEMAFQYLMAFYLVNKDLDNFMENIHRIDQMQYAALPKSFQEAFVFVITQPGYNAEGLRYYPISSETMVRMENYAYVFSRDPDARQTLGELYADTYWYFLQFL